MLTIFDCVRSTHSWNLWMFNSRTHSCRVLSSSFHHKYNPVTAAYILGHSARVMTCLHALRELFGGIFLRMLRSLFFLVVGTGTSSVVEYRPQTYIRVSQAVQVHVVQPHMMRGNMSHV
ncbi:hypothetical protein OF83DRAFT_1289977 [Amylostereum chailletii]|nr:hypothetical protein OF83DRAFT_1289977 [Amylostereum chailletii]